MDAVSLQTASQYVNNLLLARGLLRDGIQIDFAAAAKGGHETTIASVINLVHDLVLRRDRESESLTSISQSFQDLRTRATQSDQAIARLEAEKAGLQRDLTTAKSDARQAKAELKAIESKNKAYKEDIQRLRVSVGQIRAQCANDVRKRDNEITRLKKHIDIRRTRETSTSNAGPGGVTIIDPTTGKAHYPTAMLKDDSKASRSTESLLHAETNEYLTILSAELSETNEGLMHLVQSTIVTLRTLLGQSTESDLGKEAAGNGGQIASDGEPAIQIANTPSLQTLHDQLTEALGSLRSLLTNPSFAPIEEVELREEEISRLRAGWETMESRWKEAIGLMNSWRHKMVGDDSGAISLDDIQRGIDMAEEGLSVAGSPAQRKRGRKRDSSGSEISRASDDMNGDADVSMLSNGSDAQEQQAVQDEDTPKAKRVRIEAPVKSTLFPAPHILQPTCGNQRRSPSPKRMTFENLGPVDPEATPTPAQRVIEPRSTVNQDDLMSPDIWVEPELTIDEKLRQTEEEAQEAKQTVEPHAATEAVQEAPKPVKRNPVAKKTKTKRRSTLTPAELDGLMKIRR